MLIAIRTQMHSDKTGDTYYRLHLFLAFKVYTILCVVVNNNTFKTIVLNWFKL